MVQLGVLHAIWWAFNVTVVIVNKWTNGSSVSCINFICIGAYIVINILKVKPLIEVDPEDRWRRIFPLSFVFCINILLGNCFCNGWLWRKSFDLRVWASLVSIVSGILLTSMTELSFNTFGFCAALIGYLATYIKTILAESLLQGYKFGRSGVLTFCLNFSIFYAIHSITAVTFKCSWQSQVAIMASWLIFIIFKNLMQSDVQ